MASTLLTCDLRVIRRVAPPDAPCEAALAMQDGVAFLMVDSDHERVAHLMSFVGAEHVWAPVDLWRRSDGHDVMMPRVVEPLEMFLERRRGDVVLAGELVTLACSVLRGLNELYEHEANAAVTGRWWATDSGRPVFAVGAGDGAAVASARMLGMLAAHTDDRELARCLVEARDATAAGESSVRGEIERRLVQIAAPRPVELGFLGATLETARVFTQTSPVLPRRRAHREQSERNESPGRRASLFEAPRLSVMRVVEEVRQRMEGTRARLTRTSTPQPRAVRDRAVVPKGRAVVHKGKAGAEKPSRKRVWVFAIALAVMVVAGGLLWPDDGDSATPGPRAPVEASADEAVDAGAREAAAADGASAGAEPVVPSATAQPAPKPVESAPAAVVAQEGQPEITAEAVALMVAVGECDTPQSCTELLADTALMPLVPRAGAVELVDDYGGIAVFSVTSHNAPVITVVIEKRDERWLIREVYGEQ
ncbi:hypothetical protein [Microbacterium sp. NC79]|uniref:hypothetical protein n=1 Tax=Microbacterium sp. NC79 TaxID=2851009 RepID=UPI001C2B8A95|nr:hypothetical protein [Microbacterium sp. NC79]MBV0895018.1 hypothetical protein [Microbacterium sp. NC79]